MVERLKVGPIGENAYVILGSRDCILVDPGDEAQRILAFLDSRDLVPSHIVLTHGHLDHTAAIPELLAVWAERGFGPLLAAHSLDADYFGESGEEKNRDLFAAIRAIGYFRSYWKAMKGIDLLLEDGATLPVGGFRVIHTPGHTRGSICLYGQAERILISGDTLFESGVGRTDGPDASQAELEKSLARLALLPPETVVLPGHGEATTIGRELGADGSD
ncbi:MAG TPA: MBL fold metallo-hydrolase [Rectinemataceae bacterium]|nr:MBL fold metallo-hydrolase [Rectinemataceae bacterium]